MRTIMRTISMKEQIIALLRKNELTKIEYTRFHIDLKNTRELQDVAIFLEEFETIYNKKRIEIKYCLDDDVATFIVVDKGKIVHIMSSISSRNNDYINIIHYSENVYFKVDDVENKEAFGGVDMRVRCRIKDKEILFVREW